MKRAEFHQAKVVVIIRVLDDERSYGTQRAEIDLFVDTDEEWDAVREQITKAMKQVEEQVNASSD